jgi:integrase
MVRLLFVEPFGSFKVDIKGKYRNPSIRLERGYGISFRQVFWVRPDRCCKHSGRVKAAIDRWLAASGITEGWLFRPVNKGGNVCRKQMTSAGVCSIVQEYDSWIAPYDLRRTSAQMARKASCSIEQIRLSLGHASVQTTERYLGTRLDLADAPSDRIKLHT